MHIIIGSDHAGFQLKAHLIPLLESQGHTIEDLGCHHQESVDYPDFGNAVARTAVQKDCPGIVICGSGIGISIAANKVSGARCALCTNTTMAKYARLHNDANILAIGARMTGITLAEEIVHTFLSTQFEGGRHQRRVDKIES